MNAISAKGVNFWVTREFMTSNRSVNGRLYRRAAGLCKPLSIFRACRIGSAGALTSTGGRLATKLAADIFSIVYIAASDLPGQQIDFKS